MREAREKRVPEDGPLHSRPFLSSGVLLFVKGTRIRRKFACKFPVGQTADTHYLSRDRERQVPKDGRSYSSTAVVFLSRRRELEASNRKLCVRHKQISVRRTILRENREKRVPNRYDSIKKIFIFFVFLFVKIQNT